ncbi:MAG: helix-turn-helix transcriptional regulator, partial [Dehalococcoidia bacterium]
AQLAFVNGDLDGAVEKGYEFRRLAEAVGAAGWGQLFGAAVLMRPLLELGRYEEALEVTQHTLLRVVCLAHMERLDEAREALRADEMLRRVLSGNEESTPVRLIGLLEAAGLTGDAEVAAVLMPRLDPLADLASWAMPDSCPGSHLGAAAALLGRRELALDYYRRALAVAERVRFRPEIALIRLQRAELLATGDTEARQQAAEELAFLVPELEAMQMAPALERARALAQRDAELSTSGHAREPRRSYPAGLSAREVEVLRLVAAGKSNQEIAGLLVVSLRTVTFHVTNILTKTGCSNRTEATAYAHRVQLLGGPQ